MAGPSPMRALAPGRMLASSASHLAAIACTAFRPASLEVSTEIDRLVLRCLEKRPDRRPQSAADLARELRRLGGPMLTEGHGASVPSVLAPPPSSVKPWMLVLGTAAAIGIVAAAWATLKPPSGLATAATVPAPVVSVGGPNVLPPPSVPLSAPVPPGLATPVSVAPPGPSANPTMPAGADGMHAVRIETMPPGAVADPEGSTEGCTTPCTLDLPASRVFVVLQKPGYREERASVGPKEALVRLTLAKEGTPRDIRPAPTAKPARPIKPKPPEDINNSETLNPFGEKKE